jgi:hypothetical protein
MGLEQRGNNRFYYEKVRRGSRVVSVYAGKGEIAFLRHQLDLLKREEGEIERSGRLEERMGVENVDRVVSEFCEEVAAAVTATFLVRGYHQHSRQWRKKRTASK